MLKTTHLQRKKLLKKLFKALYLILLTIALVIVMQVFLFASFEVPTDSMEPEIWPGDFVLVNKLLIGPRIYNNLGLFNGSITPYKRIKGMHPIRRNDILVFDAPYLLLPGTLNAQTNLFYIKRCIAIPGDTFFIENGFFGIKGYQQPLGNLLQQLLLSQTPDETISKHIFNCFPQDSDNHWNIKDFGPIYIPGKGDAININVNNIAIYRPLIQYETGKTIRIEGGSVLLNRESIENYTFTRNYYFMAGDHVANSDDSRYWGLLPEDLVVGKAILIWKSTDPFTHKFRWKRWMKRLK
jgi:signal peptidase I